MAEAQQLRKELLQRAKELRSQVSQLASSIPDPTAAPVSPGASSWSQPVQPLAQHPEAPQDFRLAEFPEAVKRCKQIIASLRKHKEATAFLHPVDPIALGIPDYPKVVQKPMDLGTVARKLEGHHRHYVMAQDFAEDVRLIWNNCKLYNGQQHALSVIASDLERFFEVKFKLVLDRFSGLHAGTPAKRVKNDHNYDRAPKDENPMTFDEKQQLGQLIGMLDNSYSTSVFDLIKRSCPQALDESSNDVELDIEKLDARTARELERYVKAALKASGQ